MKKMHENMMGQSKEQVPAAVVVAQGGWVCASQASKFGHKQIGTLFQ